MNKNKIEKRQNTKFDPEEYVTLTIAGKRAEIKGEGFKPAKGFMNIKRGKGGQILNSKTGEIIFHQKYQKRVDSLKGIKKSLTDLYWLIAANVKGRRNELFLTLTYREPYQLDPHQAKKDWKKFYNNLKRNYSRARYIAIFEPQGALYHNKKGEYVPSWHIHVIIFGLTKIPNDQLKRWWKHGNVSFINIGQLARKKNINNLAEYFTSYTKNLNPEFMSTTAISIAKDNGSEFLQSTNKQIAKAARLYFYPANFKIYTCSQNLNHEKVKHLKFKDIDQSVLGKVTSSSTIIVKNGNGKKLNEHKYINFDR